MKENSVIWNEYPEDMEVAIPSKWVAVAESLLNEDQFKEWLFYVMKHMGICGDIFTGDTTVDMVLRAVYEENEDFFDGYWKSILRNRNKNIPIADKLKVMHAWTKEDQLDAYTKRQRK